jgi:hypothetical protein
MERTDEGACEPPNKVPRSAGAFAKLFAFQLVSATAKTVPTVTVLTAAFKSVA